LPWTGGQLVEMDWDGNIVWKYLEPYIDSHDRARMRNGNTLIQKFVKVPEDIAIKVKGGIPETELDGVMWGLALQEITQKGKVVWEWLTYEHLSPELDAITPLVQRYLWPGFNSLGELPDGNIMTSSFATSNIYIIDKGTGNIKWRWGQGITSFPHDPTMLDNGNILLFDNGRYRGQWQPPDFSRVIEVNPSTNEIEWEYKAENPVDFFSTYLSSCQRLPNGNTLICAGALGRFFEVSPSGEIVWEYEVPFYARSDEEERYGLKAYGLSNLTFRCSRYGPDYPGLQGKELNPERLDLWNRLYGPEAFGLVRPLWRGTQRAPIADEMVPVEKKEPVAREEPKPSVAKPGAKPEQVRSRLKHLGY